MSFLLHTKSLCKHLVWMIEKIDDDNDEKYVKRNLTHCINFHTQIQKYYYDIHDITSFIIFVQHLNALLGSCTIIFQASLVSKIIYEQIISYSRQKVFEI